MGWWGGGPCDYWSILTRASQVLPLQILDLEIFYQTTPSWLKVGGGGVVGWWGGGPCDYCVSPSPKNWVSGFFRLGLTSGSGFGACWDRGLGT